MVQEDVRKNPGRLRTSALIRARAESRKTDAGTKCLLSRLTLMFRRPMCSAVLLGCCCAASLAAQGPATDTTGVLLNAAAEAVAEQTAASLARALTLFREAREAYRQRGDRSGEGQALVGEGGVLAKQGRPDSAAMRYELAATAFRLAKDAAGEGLALNDLGELYVETDRVDSGLVYLRASLELSRRTQDRKEEGTTLGNIGQAFQMLSRPDSAAIYCGLSLALAREVHDSAGIGTQLGNLAAIEWLRGHPDSALHDLREALSLFRALGDRSAESQILQELGSLYLGMAQWDSALATLRASAKLSQVLGDVRSEAGALHEIGMLYRNQRVADSALVFLRRAYQLAQEGGDTLLMGFALNNIGLTLQDQGRYDTALVVYQAALRRRRQAGDRRGEGVTLGNIGAAYNQLQQRDSALAAYLPALALVRETGNPRAEAYTLGNLARTHEALGHPVAAVAYFDSAAAIIADIGRRAGADPLRVGFLDLVAEITDPWPLAWLQRADSIGPGPAALASLAVAERVRGQGLLALLREVAEAAPAGEDMIAEGTRLVGAIQRESVGGLFYFTGRQDLVIWVIPPVGEARAIRRAIGRDSLAAIVSRYRRALGADGGAPTLAVRGAALELAPTSAPSSEARSGTSLRRTAEELASLLLPSEVMRHLAGAREVVIIPQGVLALIPFAALPVGPAGDPLGTTHALRYGPSLATLGQAEATPSPLAGGARTAALRRSLVVGNPAMPEVTVEGGERGALGPLPGAEAEARTVAGLLGVTSLSGTIATETEILRRLPGAPVVHLATHGFAYSTESKTRASFVAMAPDNANDGLLTVGEILDDPTLKLSADLVVLSACETGLGNLKQAEGTVGLQRAFLARGARSVLVSLWRVSDVVTAELMEHFYTHWLDDRDQPSKAEALRRAQEDIRSTPGWEHPRFWAAFQLVGGR